MCINQGCIDQVMGGNPFGCPLGDPDPHYCPGGGFSWGPSAESLMAAGEFPGVITTQWTRGQPEQVRGWEGGAPNSNRRWVGGSWPTMVADTATDSARKR